MNRLLLQSVALIALILMIPSCIVPYPRVTLRSPMLIGRVVDSKNGAPVSNAIISGAQAYMEISMNPENQRCKHKSVKPATFTKADGTFQLPKTHNFLLTKTFFAPCSGSIGDESGESIQLFMVSVEGYAPLVFETPEHQKQSFEAGDLKLEAARLSR